ncbi:MAG: acylphosphatase [Phycisphaerae bacterium]|nr:acylphosphatase [Phycisphaerae bacterium]
MTDRNKSTGNGGGIPKSDPSDAGTRARREQTAKHVVFRGHVQGVGFRYTARQIAQQYNAAGFVRNLPDGTVEMFLQGPDRDIDNCLREIQDFFAGYLRDTQIEEAVYTPRYTDFRVTF